jgi:hypothetical protein
MIALTSLVGFLVVSGEVMPHIDILGAVSASVVDAMFANRSWVAMPHILGQLQRLFCFWCCVVEIGLLSTLAFLQCATISRSLQEIVPSRSHARVSVVARCIHPVHAHSEINRCAQHSHSHAAVRYQMLLLRLLMSSIEFVLPRCEQEPSCEARLRIYYCRRSQ